LQSRHADSSWLAALYKRLDSAGQRQALETFAGQLLEPLFELDPPQIARHCEAHPAPAPLTRLCGLLRQLDRAPLRELGDTLLPVAQSDQAPLLGQLARLRYGQRSYMLTLARLLNIEQLTPSQRQTLALTLPVHADLLPALQRLFTDLEPAGQLQLLDRLEKGLAGDALRAWLDQLNPRAMPQSTRYRLEALPGLSPSAGLEARRIRDLCLLANARSAARPRAASCASRSPA